MKTKNNGTTAAKVDNNESNRVNNIAMPAGECGDLCYDYFGKSSVIVFGNTDDHAAQLEAIGGKYSDRLKYSPLQNGRKWTEKQGRTAGYYFTTEGAKREAIQYVQRVNHAIFDRYEQSTEGGEYLRQKPADFKEGDRVRTIHGLGTVTANEPQYNKAVSVCVKLDKFTYNYGWKGMPQTFIECRCDEITRYTEAAKSETADERKAIMKTYDIDVHFDASIRMHGIIAESEEQAREIARQRAKEMNLFAAAVECEDAGEKVAESHELTAEELRREEREQVQELVPWLLEQVTPTEWHDCAEGYPFIWTDYQSEDATEWERRLIADIANGTHPETALYNRYARMAARQKWEEFADGQRRDWDEAWAAAQRDPEGTRVIIETPEADPSAPRNAFGRYYMVDGSEREECYIEYAGQWVVTRVDTVTSPFEVQRPNWCSAQGYADSSKQLCCRSSHPANVTRWAYAMINAGRVLDIYNDGY